MSFNPVQILTSDTQLRQSWVRLQSRIVAALASGGAGYANVLFVSKDGNDATAQRGSLAKKYLTIQAAVNSAQAGDLVVVGPGLFAESVIIPSSAQVGIVGSGDDTTIRPPSGDAIYYAPDGDNGLLIAGLRCDGGDIRISPIDPGGGQPSRFGESKRWIIRDVLLDNGASIRANAAMNGWIESVRSRQGYNGVLLAECEETFITGCRMIHTSVSWTPGNLMTSVIAGHRLIIEGSWIPFVSQAGLARIEASGCRFDQSVSVSPTQGGPGSSEIGSFTATGCEFGYVTVNAAISDATFLEIVELVGSTITSLITTNSPGPNYPRVRVRNCSFREPGPPVSVDGGNGCTIDLRGSTVRSAKITQNASAPFSDFYVSSYDLTDVLGLQLVGPGPTNLSLPIRFRDPLAWRMFATTSQPGTSFALTGATNTSVQITPIVNGAPPITPVAVNIVLTQGDTPIP